MVADAVPRDLVVFLEPGPGRGPRLHYAAALAKRWQAHLVAVFVTPQLALTPHVGFAVGAALDALLAEHERHVEAEQAAARAEFETLVQRRSFTAEWRVSDREPGEALMLHARHVDLAILGPPARQRDAATPLGLSESLIFASGRPCLLLPDSWPDARLPRRIVVGWNGSGEATRAIADAMPLLAAAEAVHLLVVPEARMRRRDGDEPGADMALHLARHDVPVTLEQRSGDDAGAALLARCAEVDADLLVIGAIGRARVGEFVFGGATRTILGEAALPLLLSR